MSEETQPSKVMIVIAFAALYVIWGSTYLAIKVAIETMPPFLMATVRFFIAGALLYGAARASGAARPTWGAWRHSLIVGGLLIAGGNGIVSFAEMSIDSSMAALIIASSPFFMTIFSWWGGVQKRPNWKIWLSLLGGFCGVLLLLATRADIKVGSSLLGYLLVVGAVIFWALGCVYSKKRPLDLNPWTQSGMQMLCGGAVCLVIGAVLGEYAGFELSAVSSRSWIAFAYLIFAGSLAGFTSYVYLLRHCSPSTVSSHAYVNPVVAVVLGWLILGETLNAEGFVASGVILFSVYLLLRYGERRAKVTRVAT